MTGRNENPFPKYIPDRHLLARFDSLASMARVILPEPAKKMARKLLGRSKLENRIGEIISVQFEGMNATFRLQTKSCIYRILADNAERPFGEDLMKTIRQSVSPIFADVGCAQGIFTIPAGVMGATVFAFDPDPVSQALIKNNLELNPAAKESITVFDLALGDESKPVKLNFDRKGIHTPSLKKTSTGLVDTALVQMETLDGLIEQGIVQPPTIIKIDVEGA
ncbi:hypothetical protein A2954_06330 [Candidatus Roizmanbacteria bacterium RIFCSPLOWO2_01_FULL_37_12]|uniref:Methyltransferase FkbM domain-containing protein n=1 Tax=Candidatus Roizmanbacteria bacterium RIFCSPLOWO2_01_FULL_37_12 TaxID=1802056 RepID=A0A1F7IAT3_9BACT|nr:MAG: hypothetical protein A2768_01670 [Candidatus Roizmanbacteria bacterium RIFCSPHIGHO2_01_FULL_37_16]OGK25772.1 MAG: hypothetical protein A3D76_02175 [Candidatus Roizmanbacteria bacterium RIFCSPHIGHO2_02_FULL_37_9b]OGK40474.1 MAG: hypothetical protein A2954_06330 [Candidatus Roizmanbacteria bacterium RIFCSPLOWO2_01_FULL_37_12]